MFDPKTGRWFSVDPRGFEANDANLWRYVRNNPTNRIDPSGLGDERLPLPPRMGQVGEERECEQLSDIRVLLERRGIVFGNRDKIYEKIPKATCKTLPKGAILRGDGRNVGRGTYKFIGQPRVKVDEGVFFGTGGAGPCVGVLIKCCGGGAIFHFDVGNDARSTISKYGWKECTAVVFGGDNNTESIFLLHEVIDSLESKGIKVECVPDRSGVWIGPGGGYYIKEKE